MSFVLLERSNTYSWFFFSDKAVSFVLLERSNSDSWFSVSIKLVSYVFFERFNSDSWFDVSIKKVSCVFLERSNCDSWLLLSHNSVSCVLLPRFTSFSLFTYAISALRLVYSSRRSSVRPLYDTLSWVSGFCLILCKQSSVFPIFIESPLSYCPHLVILVTTSRSKSLPPLSYFYSLPPLWVPISTPP